MGMKSVRMSRKDHPMPIMSERSPRAAAKYSDEQRPRQPEKLHTVHSMVPPKQWPEDISQRTSPPKSYARSTGHEGHVRGRQSDKSSKSPTK